MCFCQTNAVSYLITGVIVIEKYSKIVCMFRLNQSFQINREGDHNVITSGGGGWGFNSYLQNFIFFTLYIIDNIYFSFCVEINIYLRS